MRFRGPRPCMEQHCRPTWVQECFSKFGARSVSDSQAMLRLCYTVLCCAVLCYAVLCYAVLWCAMLCYAVLCCAMLCYAVLCCADLWSSSELGGKTGGSAGLGDGMLLHSSHVKTASNWSAADLLAEPVSAKSTSHSWNKDPYMLSCTECSNFDSNQTSFGMF